MPLSNPLTEVNSGLSVFRSAYLLMSIFSMYCGAAAFTGSSERGHSSKTILRQHRHAIAATSIRLVLLAKVMHIDLSSCIVTF